MVGSISLTTEKLTGLPSRPPYCGVNVIRRWPILTTSQLTVLTPVMLNVPVGGLVGGWELAGSTVKLKTVLVDKPPPSVAVKRHAAHPAHTRRAADELTAQAQTRWQTRG